mgnify:CR=1 FL=1
MAGIFVPYIEEFIDSAKDIDIHIIIKNEKDISNGNLKRVVDDIVQSSYPYTRKSVINIYNYKHTDEHKNIPWRHQIIFHEAETPDYTKKKHQLIIRNLKDVEFKQDWWINLIESLPSNGGLIYYD